uniref:Uncharacterized protein n=1 Tax=Lepeophtheirus salmonis TaxID=72036 RepID=A0A0K2VHT7_LEPSM
MTMFQDINDVLKSNQARFFPSDYNISTITHITTAGYHFSRSECLFSVCLTNPSSQIKSLSSVCISFCCALKRVDELPTIE